MSEIPPPGDLASRNASALIALWEARSAGDWSDAAASARLAERLLAVGEPLVAHDVVHTGLEQHPSNLRLRELLGLALARCGATGRALEALERLHAEGSAGEETLGLLARVHKDLAQRSSVPAERARHLREAATLYANAYARTGGHWTGINTATMLLLTAEREKARAVALQVRAQCLGALASPPPDADPYWLLATLGEAALVLGDTKESEDRYRQAAKAGAGRWADLASTRRQARLIADHLGLDRTSLDACFSLPRVAAFAGHMIDRPGRAHPRFPPELEHRVRSEIRTELQRLGIGIGYASAASGSDILFLEEVLERGGEVGVVLPYDRKQFIEDSVEPVPGAGWRKRFDTVLGRASRCFTVLDQRVEWGSLSYEYASSLVLGFAAMRARQLDTDLVGLAVWDGQPGDGAGGTAATVVEWRGLGHPVDVIDLTALRRGGSTTTATPERAETRPTSEAKAAGAGVRGASAVAPFQVMSMLFADAVGFSKLTETQVRRFVDSFLPAVAESLRASANQPLLRNTWGDGLYLVFDDVRAAGLLALELVERTGLTDWTELGLPSRLDFRIALHVGPVLGCANPVTGRHDYLGTQVSRAARIEPITPPGEVYATEEFAAHAEAHRVSEFVCEYVGRVPLAKGFGSFPTYHVRRRGGVVAP